MKYVYLVLSWVFGVLFLLTGLVFLIDSFLAGLSLISISLFLLPPVRSFIHLKTNKTLSPKHRTVTIFALFIAYSVFLSQSQTQKSKDLAVQEAQQQADKIAKIQQENITYFNNNRNEIITKIKEELSNQNYEAVISSSSKYLISGDEELKNLNSQANTKRAKIIKDKTTKDLLAKVKKVPSSKLSENNDIYKQLLALHPENNTYKNKVDFYTGEIEKEREKRLAAEARVEQIKAQFSAWDGSHRNLERVVKKAMNDPDSYEHDETVYWDKGDHLIVRMSYRGKNAFGGIVKNFVKAKVSLDGQVLQIIDQT
jgi:hypothetical protein